MMNIFLSPFIREKEREWQNGDRKKKKEKSKDITIIKVIKM